MTVSYVKSPSFSGHFTQTELNSPPQSPTFASPSSTSPLAGFSPLQSASTAPASASVSQFHAAGIVVPNDSMEAGLSLRRSPIQQAQEFAEASPSLDDNQQHDLFHQAAFTGDLNHNDRYVYRRPFVDRAFLHSQRRSQLIFEQKLKQRRSTVDSDSGTKSIAGGLSPRPRARRPNSVAHRPASSPRTPESTSSYLDVASRYNATPDGLRELTTGSAAQPASKRASWTRFSRDQEALSDSYHASNSHFLRAAASVAQSSPSSASRRHSSFLTADHRYNSHIPIFANASFSIPPYDYPKRMSEGDIQVRKPSADKANRQSTMSTHSTNSSGSSSSSKEGGSTESIEFEGIANENPLSSSTSGSGHEDVREHAKVDGNDTLQPKRDSIGDAEVFTTPRSSSEQEKAKETHFDASTEGKPLQRQPEADGSEALPSTENGMQAAPAQEPSDRLEAAPALALASLSSGAAMVPASTLSPISGPPAEPVSPTSSPTRPLRPLRAERSPRQKSASLDQTSLEDRSSKDSPFGSLQIPKGRRGSQTSIVSASSTSTFRIRRKPVPSDVDDSERRSSLASERRDSAFSHRERRGSSLSASMSDNAETGFNGPSANNFADDDAKTRSTQYPRSPNGSDFAKKSQEAAKTRALEMHKEEGLNGSAQRPSTATVAGQEAKTLEAGLSPRSPDGSINGKSSNGAYTASNVSRTPSRATIKRPVTAPVGSGGQFRSASGKVRGSVMEIEGQQFLLGQDDSSPKKTEEKSSPAIPNAVRFLRQLDVENASKRDSQQSVKSKTSNAEKTPETLDPTRSPSTRGGGGWGLEQEVKIVERVQNANKAQNGSTDRTRRASLDASKKAVDAKSIAVAKGNLLNIINEDESDEVKAAAREAGIPEGSYAIHPPSMLQLFETSQCIVYDEDGREVMFGDLFKKRRTLVCFLRHWWCGFCQQFAMSVRHIDPLPLKKANMDFVIIGQGDWHVIKAYREVMQVQYPMFADPKRNVYRALGMTLRTNDANPACARPDYASMSMTKGILVAIKKGLFDMPIRNPGDMKLLGGDFILGPGLQCSFTHRMTTADGHMDLPRILAQAGCDLSLKTPKPLITADEKESRMAMLAGGNRRQTRSLGRSRGKKLKADTSMVSDGGSSSFTGSLSPAANTSSRFNRPSLWGRFPGKFSKSQASLPNADSMVDLGATIEPSRLWPRSASAMRKISYDGRVRDSFESRQTEIEFASRATSIDTRNDRSSIVAAPVLKAQSMADLRRRFEMGASPDTPRSKSRQGDTPSMNKLNKSLPLAPKGSFTQRRSNDSQRASTATPTPAAESQKQPSSEKRPETVSLSPKPKSVGPLSSFQNQILAKQSKAPAGLGIDAVASKKEEDDAATPKGPESMSRASSKDSHRISSASRISNQGRDPVGDRPVSVVETLPRDSVSSRILRIRSENGEDGFIDISGPGSFLMDLDVYDSLSRQPSQKFYRNGTEGETSKDAPLTPGQTSDSGFSVEAADAESDTDPVIVSESGTSTPRRGSSLPGSGSNASINGNGSAVSDLSGSRSNGSIGASGSMASFYSFGTFRGKTNLEHLQEADEEEEPESGNDEPIEFEEAPARRR